VVRGLALSTLGTVVGIGGALALGRFMSGMLFGVGWYDLFTFLAVPALVIAMALLACVVPDRRELIAVRWSSGKASPHDLAVPRPHDHRRDWNWVAVRSASVL